MKRYVPKSAAFKFPFRIGGRSMATGSYNAPKRGRTGSAPPIKQFSQMKPGRPKPRTR